MFDLDRVEFQQTKRGGTMPATSDSLLAEEQQRSEEVYDRIVRPKLLSDDYGKFVVIAFDQDDYEIDADEVAAYHRLRSRHPEARLWLMRTGPEPAYRIRQSAGVSL
jgi:hypothetical protein